MTEFILPDVPVTQLLVRTRDSIQILDGPINSNESISLRKTDLFSEVTDLRICPIYSPDGNIVVYVYEKKIISVHNTTTGALLFTLPVGDAEYVEFSPKGTFLLTWSRATKGSAVSTTDSGNFRIWDMTGALVTSFSLKIYKPQSIQWTGNEEYAFRLVTNEIQIFNGHNLTIPIDKVYHKGLTQFQITSTVIPYISIAAFNPEAGGKPARVTLFRYTPTTPTTTGTPTTTTTTPTSTTTTSTTTTTSVTGPVSSRTIFAASEAKLMWNSPGTALLVYAQADTDATSYYGATGLFLLQAHTDAAIKVQQSKDGPVHDVQWSPVGDRFVVSAGTMPCHTTLHDTLGEPVYQYGAAHRNTISWSPHGRFLCIAGFGNLAGEMDFYDTLRSKKIGSTASHCATYYAWSPDSRHFVTASLAPRMNVDNNLKVFKYNGAGPVVHVPFERAYDVRWRPTLVSVYPNRGPSPKRGGGEADAVVPTKPVVAPVQAYRPPGSTGALSKLMNKETAPTGKIVTKNTTNTTPVAKFTPSVQRARVIPGMAPAVSTSTNKKVTSSTSSGVSTGVNGGSTGANGGTSGGVKSVKSVVKTPTPTTTTSPVATTTTTTTTAVDDSKEGREKRAKVLSKKLKAIVEIRAKQAAGQVLEPEQKLKLDSEAELLAELNSLTV